MHIKIHLSMAVIVIIFLIVVALQPADFRVAPQPGKEFP